MFIPSLRILNSQPALRQAGAKLLSGSVNFGKYFDGIRPVGSQLTDNK
jgi:hypothetical protein